MKNGEIFRALLANAAIIFSGIYLMGRYVPLGRENRKYNIYKIIGVTVIASASLFFPIKYESGILIDFRQVPLATFGLISGGAPALVAALITGIVRLFLGGDGAWPGFWLVCILPAATGGLLHLYDEKKHQGTSFVLDSNKFKYLVVLAVSSWVYISMALYFIVPEGREIFGSIAVIYFIVLIGAYYFIGTLIVDCMNAQCYRKRLEYEASTDFTTDLVNYRYFIEKARQAFDRCASTGRCCSILLIDIDDFKKFNDTYGHLKGDRLLAELSDLMVNNTRSWDVVARYGGEEFIIFMENTDIVIAKMVAERIRKKVERTLFISGEGSGYNITISTGIAGYPWHGDTLMEVIEKADIALYGAKGQGKNATVVYKKEEKIARGEAD